MELQKTYVVVTLTNSESDLKENWIKINKLREKKELNKNEYENFYLYDASMVTGGSGAMVADIDRNLFALKKVNLCELPEEYGICLFIEDREYNDTIEYEYLALMLQNEKDMVAYIYPQDRQKVYEVYRKVSHYFSFFIQKPGRRERICILQPDPDGKQGLFIGPLGTAKIYRVPPVLEFGETGEYVSEKSRGWNFDLEMWTRTVGELLDECEDLERIRCIESYQEIRIQLSKAKNKDSKESWNQWREKREELDKLCKANFGNHFLCHCIDYFVTSENSQSLGLMEERRGLFWSDEVQGIIRNMPIISFYMLCIQLRFLKRRENNFVEHLNLLLVNAEGLTEGVLQLLENLHHTSQKRGLLSIRVHEKKDIADTHLRRNYAEIYETAQAKYFYELRVLDSSGESILENFRAKQATGEIPFPENIGLQTFFEHSEGSKFWSKYNKVPGNLVHHYGLQIFSTVISNNGGYFRVISSSKTKPDMKLEQYCNQPLLEVKEYMHIPGTEYVILLPLLENMNPINPSMEADIQYQFDLQKKYSVEQLHIGEDKVAIEKQIKAGLTGQRLKEWRVDSLKDTLLQQFEKGTEAEDCEFVGVLSAKDWEWKDIEIYCKALILCLINWKPENNQGLYLVIRNCSANDFIAITRMFAIFYGKGDLSTYMEKLQIYLSGVDPSEEFLITGKDIFALLTIARKLTLVRGIQPQCLRSIEYIFDKFGTRKKSACEETSDMKLVPFDMLDLPHMEGTLFEQAVGEVLESDIQKYSFGCKLKHTHMRIGSKLHINNFYEAELLFHNNYYVSRFALLLARNLMDVLAQNKPIMFVGYENYSELLLYELVKSITDRGYDCSYMIYEGRNEGRFRYYSSPKYIMDKKNLQFVAVVPINSTMTTHSKLRAALLQEINKVAPEVIVNIAINYALILVRSEEESDMEAHYYVSDKEGIIESKYLPDGERAIRYFVAVNTKWNNPLECDECFPKDSMLNEQPLIETNRESIIPVQMIGIQESEILSTQNEQNKPEEEKDPEWWEKNETRVRKLANCLIYRHIVRKGNHFIFYFELEKYFMQNREDIIAWLKKVKSNYKKPEGIVYDVIVAPLHYSNAGFVTEVNSQLYGNAALVLNFEVEKEYRENVKTKYSNIIGLYKKLLEIGKEAELRFHFVDDNIITGNTYMRAKSLFASLFSGIQDNVVKVKVFADVIVMLNRMSESSIMNYVENRDEYHAYVSLSISSMRSHEDACTQCKVVENAQKLRNQASTNQMYEFWDHKIYHHQMIEAESYQSKLEEEREDYPESQVQYELRLAERRKRAERRMLCTHMFNNQVGELDFERNDTAKVKNVMLDILRLKTAPEMAKQEAMEWIISGIKVFSRPFVSFRKSNREAIFQIMLELVEFITNVLVLPSAKLKSSKFTRWGDIKELCVVIRDAKLLWKQDDKIYVLLLTLMQRLSDLSSSYVIRKENIKKLFAVMKLLDITEEQRECFKQRYLSIVKRVTCLSSDENKCIYLEYLLLFHEEYENPHREDEILKTYIPENIGFDYRETVETVEPGGLSYGDFQKILFLENTRVLYDGIRDLAGEIGTADTGDEIWHLIKEKYYYTNFERLLKYYKFITVEDDGKETSAEKSIIQNMVDLYRMLTTRVASEKGPDVELFYDNLLGYIETITGTQGAKLIFSNNAIEGNDKSPNKVYVKQRKREIEIENAEYQGNSFIYDTYMIRRNEDTKVLIKYRNYVGRGYSAKDRNPMNEVYLELTFLREIQEVQLMMALKCIMVFRNLIVENLEKDFSNNLMQKWSAEQNFKKHMRLERATDHTAKDELAEDYKMLLGDMKGCDPQYQRALFNLIINSYIARMNVQLLADALPEGENVEYSFGYLYWRKLYALIERLKKIEEDEDKKVEILDKNGKPGFSEEVLNAQIRMYRGERRCERLSLRRLSIVVIELIRSAVKYSDNCKVYIYRENQYLVVKNSFKSPKPIAKIQQEAKDAYSRKSDGISLAVIKELIDRFYNLEESEAVVIDAQEEEEYVAGKKKKTKYYYVKIPILSD